MSGKVTDEMLMAYVDGELDPATHREVERALAADDGLRSRAESFRASRSLAREAFADMMARPVPDRLMKLLSTEERPAARAVSWWRSQWAMVPLAATLAVGAGLGGFLLGQGQLPAAGGGLLGGAELAALLSETPGGEERVFAAGGGDATYRTLGTYRVQGGECRIFEVFGEGVGSVRGVGCDRGGGWGVDIAAMQGDPDGITPASDEALASIDAYLDALEAEGPTELE